MGGNGDGATGVGPGMRTLALLVALVTAAGCSGSGAGGEVLERSGDGRYERIGVGDISTWRHAASSGDGLDALIEGVIGHDPECGMWIHQPEVDVRYPVVWPAGTTIEQADPLTLQLPDGAAVRVGDRVAGGGGYHTLDLVTTGCAETGETAVFNASEDVEVSAGGPVPSQASEGGPGPSAGATASAALPDAVRLLAEEVGQDVAVAIHDHGRCRGEEVPPGAALFRTLRFGDWTPQRMTNPSRPPRPPPRTAASTWTSTRADSPWPQPRWP